MESLSYRVYDLHAVFYFSLEHGHLTKKERLAQNTYSHAPKCHLEMLDELQKQICRTVGCSLDASLKPLAHC